MVQISCIQKSTCKVVMIGNNRMVDKKLVRCTKEVHGDITDYAYVDEHLNSKRLTAHRVHASEMKNLVAQLGASDSQITSDAARMIADTCAGIDINMGCPMSFSIVSGMGASLLKSPDRAEDILKTLRRVLPCASLETSSRYWRSKPSDRHDLVAGQLPLGVSAKIRLLSTQEETIELVKRLISCNISTLCVHCRQQQDRNDKVHADWSRMTQIADICRNSGVISIVNGDIWNRCDVRDAVAVSGADGAMFARGAVRNMSVFKPCVPHAPCDDVSDGNCFSYMDEPLTVCDNIVKALRRDGYEFPAAKYFMNTMNQNYPRVAYAGDCASVPMFTVSETSIVNDYDTLMPLIRPARNVMLLQVPNVRKTELTSNIKKRRIQSHDNVE